MDVRPIKLNARGKALADRIASGLAAKGVDYQREALPNDDYRFHVAREHKDMLAAVAQAAVIQKAVVE